jgi:hypothetical protein
MWVGYDPWDLSERPTMPIDPSVTGTWVGEYFQHDRPHAITAELVQSGEVLTGSMRDGEPDQEMSVTEVASGMGNTPGMDEQIVAKLREMFPEAPVAPVRYVSHLPPESTLEGWIRGPGLYFLKSYQGVSFGGFRLGDRVVGEEIEDPTVHYSGRVGPGGEEIEGRWWIDPTPEAGGRRTEGSFILRRRGDAQEATRAASTTDRPFSDPSARL